MHSPCLTTLFLPDHCGLGIKLGFPEIFLGKPLECWSSIYRGQTFVTLVVIKCCLTLFGHIASSPDTASVFILLSYNVCFSLDYPKIFYNFASSNN